MIGKLHHCTTAPCAAACRSLGIETRGITDHGFIRSAYFRDPDGYVVELTAKMPRHDAGMEPALNGARRILDDWQARKLR